MAHKMETAGDHDLSGALRSISTAAEFKMHQRRKDRDTMITFDQTKAGDLTIRIPRAYIRHAVKMMDILPAGSHVTHTKTFSDALLTELQREQEDGATSSHFMLDQAISNAIDNGAEGVRIPNDY